MPGGSVPSRRSAKPTRSRRRRPLSHTRPVRCPLKSRREFVVSRIENLGSVRTAIRLENRAFFARNVTKLDPVSPSRRALYRTSVCHIVEYLLRKRAATTSKSVCRSEVSLPLSVRTRHSQTVPGTDVIRTTTRAYRPYRYRYGTCQLSEPNGRTVLRPRLYGESRRRAF